MRSYIKIYDDTNHTTEAFQQPDDASITVSEKLDDVAKFEADITITTITETYWLHT